MGEMMVIRDTVYPEFKFDFNPYFGKKVDFCHVDSKRSRESR